MTAFSLKQNGQHPRWVAPLCLLLGAGAFFWVLGPLVLNPSNIAWLGGGFDPTQHYLGWAFFRQSPWSFPLGLNPAFGMDISSSIVYSDSIPLLAFLFKPFAALLPEPFQYFGLWLLLCFILQAYFAWRLIALLNLPNLATIGATCLFVFSPPLFWRIGMHAALVAHWLILAGLYLHFRLSRSHRLIYWALLLGACALVHFYLLTMVLGLFIASMIDDARNYHLVGSSLKRIGIEVMAIFFLVLLTMWQAGYFVVSQSATATLSYGVSRMNALAPLDARQWSYVLPSLPDAQGALSDMDMSARAYENFMFWGAGVLLLFLVGLIIFLLGLRATKDKQSPANIPAQVLKQGCVFSWARNGALYVMLIGYTAFALSNKLAVGSWSWSFSLSQWIYEIASMYRASSRFFWPLFYTLVFLGIAYVARHLSPTKLTLLIVTCALIQIGDTRIGWATIRNVTMRPVASQLPTELRDSFWEEAAKRYQHIIRIPVDSNWVKVLPSHWSTFAAYAAKHGMQTNSAYLARQSAEKLQQSNARLQAMLSSGQWHQNTLYILGNEEVRVVLEKADSKKDLLATMNGHIVFAPDWLACAQCTPIAPMVRITSEMVQSQVGVPISFADLGNGKYFLQGSNWAYPESWGVWAVGPRAQLNLPLPLNTGLANKTAGIAPKVPRELILDLRALVNARQTEQTIQMSVNGQSPVSYVLTQDAHNRIAITLSPKVLADGFVSLSFDLPTAKRPKDIGMGSDDRFLSIGLISATFQ